MVTEECNQPQDRQQHKVQLLEKYVMGMDDGGREGFPMLGWDDT